MLDQLEIKEIADDFIETWGIIPVLAISSEWMKWYKGATRKKNKPVLYKEYFIFCSLIEETLKTQFNTRIEESFMEAVEEGRPIAPT
jgi:hypothetical protein